MRTLRISLSVFMASLLFSVSPPLSGDAPYASEPETQTETEENASAVMGTPGSVQESLYHENEWNYVEDSMDVSAGIPDTVTGRLSLIRDKGVLTVVTEPYFAPQEFIDPDLSGQDQYAGADMELARLIAQRMGVGLEIVPLEFPEVLSSISAGKYDLAISGLSYTPGRAASMEMSKGYHYSPEEASSGLIIRSSDTEEIAGPEDLAGRNLAAQSGSLQELLVAQNLPDYLQFIRVSSVRDVYDAVSNGLADAGGVDLETAKLYLRNNPDCGLVLMEGVAFGVEEQFQGDRVAGPKDDLELMYFVNGVIDEAVSSGQYEEWLKKAAKRSSELGL